MCVLMFAYAKKERSKIVCVFVKMCRKEGAVVCMTLNFMFMTRFYTCENVMTFDYYKTLFSAVK